MLARSLIIIAALGLCGCGQAQDKAGAPQLEAPEPESEPSRAFAPVGETAARVTGAITVSVAQNFPDADSTDAAAAPREMLHVRGESGFALEAELIGAASPATMIEGQTVRAVMGLPVEAASALIYRVVLETKAAPDRGLCGEALAGHVLVWEPEGVGEGVFKLMGLRGGEPGQPGVRMCPALDYRRA